MIIANSVKIRNFNLSLFIVVLLLFSCKSDNNTIRIKGSDTEVNLVADISESFHTINPKLLVSISGGGSGLGIASLINGTTDIANSSRRINKKEIEIFYNKSIQIDSFIFAQDAIAFVVSENVNINSISTSDLSKILNGTYSTWSQLTRENLPVNIYGRQSNSGTYDFVKNKLGIEFSTHAKQMNGNAQILEAIKADNSGIGYVGAGYLIHGGIQGLKALTIFTDEPTEAVSPLDAKKISIGAYFFQRPLYQYFKVMDYKKVKPFLDFEKSEKGKKIIHSSGYYPVEL